MLTSGQTVPLAIEKPAAGGRMIARVEGQVVLVADAIPGERVQARVERIGKGVVYAQTLAVEERSADRRDPFPDPLCGGCLYSHIAYPRQLELKAQVIADAFKRIGHLELPAAADLPCHTGVVLLSPRGSGLGRVGADKTIRLVRGDRDAFGLHGRSAEQRIALDLLLDPEVGIISLGGRAGTGKSALALCAGLEAVLERQQHRKVMVFRPLYAVGGQELGYLPGNESEKMAPWAQAVFDTLGALVSQDVLDEVQARGMLEVLPLTHIRGRSLHDAFVIVDEAQSLERNVLLTVLSRLGTASRVVLTHDVAQRDNLRVGRHDGVAAVIEKLKGHPLFAHVTLTRSERSPIAALVTEMLEGPGA